MVASHQKKSDRAEEIKNFFEKIVINAGVGRLSQQPQFEEKGLVQISRDLALLSGQKPQVRRAAKSISGFKVQAGQIVGLRVTLRRRKMVDFFERLVKIVLPRVRDFRGLNLSNIDQKGALNIGLREQFVFPEINPEESTSAFSLGISLVPRVKNRALAIDAYHKLGVPLKSS